MKFTLENNVFGRNIVALRKSKKLSARKISMDIGQNPGFINNIETGKNFPIMTKLVKICDYLECQPEELFYEVDDVVENIETRKLAERIRKLSKKKRAVLEKTLEELEEN